MAYPDAPEFQTAGSGYSPDRFYTVSRFGPTGERRWVSLGRHTVPSEMYARIEDLIHTRVFPAYHSVSDFMRDAAVHHLYRRLSEAGEEWRRPRDVIAALFELERIQSESAAATELVAKWQETLDQERDPETRSRLLEKAKLDLDTLDNAYHYQELSRIIRNFER